MMDFSQAKKSFVTRNVDFSDVVDVKPLEPQEGDLLLAEVDRVRQHGRLENCHGRRVHLLTGDQIIVAAADRYATAQFHAKAPDTLGSASLVAAGGIAAQVISRSSLVKPATEITLKGVLVNNEGNPINLKDYPVLKGAPPYPAHLPVVMVLGSDMDSGKTSMASSAILGLSRSGYKVAGAKLTGTGSGPDYWKMMDAGAFQVRDFLDAGYPSTAGLSDQRLVNIFQALKDDAVQAGAEILVLELADGILQPQNQKLLQNEALLSEVSTTLVAADSSTSAVYCTEKVIEAGLPVYGVGGLFTRSELCISEVTDNLGIRCYRQGELRNTEFAEGLMSFLKQEMRHATSLAG